MLYNLLTDKRETSGPRDKALQNTVHSNTNISSFITYVKKIKTMKKRHYTQNSKTYTAE